MRLKEHKYHAPSIAAHPLLKLDARRCTARIQFLTECLLLFSVANGSILRPHRAGHHLRSWRRAAGKALSTLQAMSGRALLALQSWISSEGIRLHLFRAREKQQRA